MKEIAKKNKNLLKEQTAKAEEKAKLAIEDYKKFAIKGNIIDLAIGVVIGGAFTNIINTLVSSLVTPLLSIMTNKVNIANLFISLSGENYPTLEAAKTAGAIVISYGAIFNAVLNFFIVSVILFIVFKYIAKLRASNEKGTVEEIKQTTKACPYCKSTIDITATKCAFCTSEVELIQEVAIVESKKAKKKKVE
ncbi:MAG: large conductance mechanosensitive channel protein MscL [Clostridia bacterium]|nr:large conductance mechanosensitive channel protein MscL [Clostridia bacterium]MDD4386662.1 large conductance mechanosensitive channel protein MscL [Clostridia bacterium]